MHMHMRNRFGTTLTGRIHTMQCLSISAHDNTNIRARTLVHVIGLSTDRFSQQDPVLYYRAVAGLVRVTAGSPSAR